jgi:plastocyanin
MRPSARLASAGLAGLLLFATHPRAAPVTSKTPNIMSPETTAAGTADFVFTHRFYAPGGKVINSPTFTLDAGILQRLSLGLMYASFSDVDGHVNEFQPTVTLEILRQRMGSPLDVTAAVAYNTSATSLDGAVVLRYHLEFFSLLGIAKVFSDGYDVAGFTFATGGGLQIHLNRFLQLQGDLNKVVAAHDQDAIYKFADRFGWSGAIAFQIPYTPHSLSLYATNVNTVTLEGSSRGSETVRYGFEFDVPLTSIQRWLAIVKPPPEPEKPAPSAPAPSGSAPAPAVPPVGAAPSAAPPVSPAPAAPPVSPAPPAAPPESVPVPVPPPVSPAPPPPESAAPPAPRAPAATVDVAMEDDEFKPQKTTVPVGTTVRWTNRDKVQHTITSDTGLWDSGKIGPGATYEHKFTTPGSYPYNCTIHPFMRGTIVVTGR